jgi:ketosteroid isomerase-like protein
VTQHGQEEDFSSDVGDVVRRFYEAAAAGDLATIEGFLSPDAIWYVPGDSALSGTHRGWLAIRDDFFGQFFARSGGEAEIRLNDICVGDKYAVAIQHATGDHEERTLDLTACQVITVQNSKITEVRGHYFDPRALTDFFGPR